MASVLETTTPPAGTTSPTVRVLRESLGDQVLRVEEFRGDLAITVSRKAWVQAATLLRNHPELDYKLFLDLCGVDFLDRDDHADRYEVVLHAYSVSKKHHVRLKTTLPEADPRVDTLVGVYKGANWFEREAWDLYGIVFDGPPEPEPPPDPRGLRGPPDAEGLPDRPAARPEASRRACSSRCPRARSTPS